VFPRALAATGTTALSCSQALQYTKIHDDKGQGPLATYNSKSVQDVAVTLDQVDT